MMNLYLVDHWEFYKERGGKFPKKIYKKIINEFNQRIIDVFLTGQRVSFGHIGWFQIVRQERNFRRPRINWKASNKRKQELLDQGKELYNKDTGKGEEWLVYYTDKEYAFVRWGKGMVKNIAVSKFKANRGTKGLATKLKQFLHKDQSNLYVFKENPKRGETI